MSSMSDFVNLSQASNASGQSPQKRSKAEHAHYGFMVVEWWCASGLPYGAVVKMRPQLAGDGGAILLEDLLKRKQTENPEKLKCLHAGKGERPRMSERDLSTFPENSLVTEFAIELEVRSPGAMVVWSVVFSCCKIVQ